MPYIVSQRPSQSDCGQWTDEIILGPVVGGEVISLPDRLLALFPSIEDFYRVGVQAVERCLDKATPCCLAIVDIDRLQRIADTHGISCASDVLAAFAEKLFAMAISRGMTVGYLSCDRFGLFWNGGSGREAADVFDEIKTELTTQPFVWNKAAIFLTISIGVADIHGRETFDNYLNAAEQFVFMAQRSGRNQVVSDCSFLTEQH